MSSSQLVRILVIGALVFFGAVPSLGQEIDYIFPTKELAQRTAAVRVLPGPALYGGEKVAYTAFDGKTHELTRFPGRFVSILLPDSWLSPEALTEDLVRSFVDRADITYSHLADFMRAEPYGEGPLTVAVLPEGATCGWGCGFIGSKGVEIADIPHLNPILWREIAADKGMSVLVHEMTHNFDVYWPYLYYLPGHPHAWTDFVNLYLFLYNQEGSADGPPNEVAEHWLETTGPYFKDPTATWAHCVRDGACEDRGITANNAWGGFGFRIALFYGPRSARAAMTFLRDYAKTHSPPATPEGKEDLYVEALASGAGENLSCVANAWHWYASPALRRRMRQRWGRDNPVCKDQDRDGRSPIQGDCDDTRSTVRPGAPEKKDGADNDCNGLVDEGIYKEPGSGDFPALQGLSLPAQISGQVDGHRDLEDRFWFRLRARQRVRIGICSQSNFQGWLGIHDPAGNGHSVEAGDCKRVVYSLPRGRLQFELSVPNSSFTGSYTADLTATPPWPAPPWAQTAVPEQNGWVWALTATEKIPAGALSPTAVRFWVSGQGIVGTVPYAPTVTFDWTAPPGFDPGNAAYRVQLMSRGVPATDYTGPRGFVE